MNRILRLLTVLLMSLTAHGLSAERTFYDSKSFIVNVAGDAQFLKDLGFGSKVNPVPLFQTEVLPGKINKKKGIELANFMTQGNVGKSYIDYITQNGWSDNTLKRMALRNAQIADKEYAAEHIRSIDEASMNALIAEDYLPILRQNYIVLTQEVDMKIKKNGMEVEKKIAYAIFKVDIDKEQAYDIAMHLGTPEYKTMNFPVKFLCSGVYNPKKPEITFNRISKEAPGLALRGVLASRNPSKISIGSTHGLKKGDLVSLYSQRVNAKGEEYSKRISRARVGKVWSDQAQVNFEDRMNGNRKNGDIVVKTPDKLNRWGLVATYSPHYWGGEIRFDRKVGFTRSGIIHHLLSDFGGGVTDKPGMKYCVVDGKHEGYVYHAPVFANIGIGYGISKTFLGFIDVMPNVMAQYEAGVMTDFKGLYSDVTSNSAENNSFMGGLIWSSSVRAPLGIRVSFNLAYPVRVVLEAGYAFRFGFGKSYKVVKESCDFVGAKRNGVFVNLGIMF